MRGEADADDLGRAAAALLDEVAAGLSGGERFRVLMALSALRMAERERALTDRLAQAAVADAAGVVAALRRPEARLAADVHAALLRDAVVRTAVTKPGALTAAERAAAGLD